MKPYDLPLLTVGPWMLALGACSSITGPLTPLCTGDDCDDTAVDARDDTSPPVDTFSADDVLPQDTSPWSTDDTDAANPSPAIYEADFDDCDHGWTLATPWECGAPIPYTPPSSTQSYNGPLSAFSGTGVLATRLAADYPSSRSASSAHATSPAIAIPADGATLSFRLWYRMEAWSTSAPDGFRLLISAEGGPWSILTASHPYDRGSGSSAAWSGEHIGWDEVTADLSPWSGQSIQLRFAMFSDSSLEYAGAYIDDFVVR